MTMVSHGERNSQTGAATITASKEDIAPLLPHLRAFARSMTNGDSHLADDLVQDTVMLALRAWNQFTPGTNLKAWLFQILRNRFRSLVGRRKARTETLTEDVERRLSTPATQDNGLIAAEFKRAFAQLSPTHREVLVMVGVHGLRYEEVAEITGCELGTVKSRVFRARELLKGMLLGGSGMADPAPARPAASKRPRQRQQKAASSAPPPIAVAASAPPPAVVPVASTLVIPDPAPPLSPQRQIRVIEAERLIALAELQLTSYRIIAERMTRAGVGAARGQGLLAFAERHLQRLHRHREQLLGNAA